MLENDLVCPEGLGRDRVSSSCSWYSLENFAFQALHFFLENKFQPRKVKVYLKNSPCCTKVGKLQRGKDLQSLQITRSFCGSVALLVLCTKSCGAALCVLSVLVLRAQPSPQGHQAEWHQGQGTGDWGWLWEETSGIARDLCSGLLRDVY